MSNNEVKLTQKEQTAFELVRKFMTSQECENLVDHLNAINTHESTETKYLQYAILALIKDEICSIEEFSAIEQVFTAIEIAVEQKAINLIVNAFSKKIENRENLHDLITEIILEGEISKDDVQYIIKALQEKLASI